MVVNNISVNQIILMRITFKWEYYTLYVYRVRIKMIIVMGFMCGGGSGA
jgi:hypothetical protein